MRASWWAVIAGGVLAAAVPVAAQGHGTGDGAAPLARRVSLDLREVTLREALRDIAAQSGVSLAYDNRTVPLERRVTIRVSDAPAAEALRAVLRGFPVDVQATGGRVLLVRRADQSPPALLPPDGALSGRVTDAATGAPVPGAVVVVDGGRLRATANAQGEYRLPAVPAGVRVLTARRIGYAPAEQSVTVPEGGAVTLDFALGAVASRLDEVVTTVTGAQRRLEVGNAIGRIAADSLVGRAPITSFTDLVNARVPGAQVVLQGGLTGTSSRIRIRGINSISLANDPLLVVDGVRLESSASSAGGLGQLSGRFNDLNPEEIESIEVVKGPSAATLYGTDAANGVIVVTTRRGTPGRARWSAYAEQGVIDQAAAFPDTYYGWGHEVASGASQQCPLARVAAGQCVLDSVTTFNPLRDDETTVLGTGRRSQYGLQVSGGERRFTYALSGEREEETGYLRMPDIEAERVSLERGGTDIPREQRRPNAMSRTSLRSNLTTAFGETGEATLAFGFASGVARIPSATIFSAANLGRGYRDTRNGWGNPLPGEAFGLRNTESVTRYTTSLNGSWRPRDWLTTRGTVGLDYSSTFLDALQRRGEGLLGTGREGRRTNTRTNVWQYTTDVGASALATLTPRVSARTSVGLQYNRRLLQATTASGTRLPPGSETLTGAAVVTGSEQYIESIVAGGYLEETVGFAERLFVTAALRADGGSAFGRDFDAMYYPKASVSWVALRDRPGPVQSLRLRAAYGASGVMPAATAALPQMTLTSTQVGGVATTGAVMSAIGNPDLKPERQAELETGFDADLLRGRLRLEATYYHRSSRDALIDRPLPAELGVTSRQENIGAVENQGVEGAITAIVLDHRAAQWEVSVNGSENRSRVKRLGAGIREIGFTTGLNREGFPLFSLFATPILGYADANGNGIIEAGEVEVGDSLVYIGPSTPPRQLTFASAISLPRVGLRIATQFDHRGGFVVANSQLTVRCATANSSCRAMADPTAPLQDQASAVARNLPRPTLYGFIEDGSFVRWRELSVTYAIPPSIVRHVRARGASLTLTGRNLALFTRFRGADPEGAAFGQGLEGYNQGAGAPPARYWLVRLSLDF